MGYYALRSTVVVIALVMLLSMREVWSWECGAAMTRVMSCLTYATGKVGEPTGKCCGAVSGVKEEQPQCLCFLIAQVHNGSEQIVSLGILEPKLVQLPNACHLTNASLSDCPKLLGISPTSPAAAIFINNTTTSPPSSSSLVPASGGANKSSEAKRPINLVLILSLLFFLFSV